jgi:hypothetical protein
MTITFHEKGKDPITQPYTIDVMIAMGTINEDNDSPGVLMAMPDGEWQLTVSNHSEVYLGTITVDDERGT